MQTNRDTPSLQSRSFSLGKILRVMDRHGAVPDKHTWDSLIRIALSVGGVDAALWVLYGVFSCVCTF